MQINRAEIRGTRRQIQAALVTHADLEKAKFLPKFFKSGPGEYGEGDQFRGVAVPNVRKVAKDFRHVDLSVIEDLLHSPWHEDRLCALLLLVDRFPHSNDQRGLYEFYLVNMAYVNNWDLVDTSARDIVGRYVFDNPAERGKLDSLANSDSLWERRIAIISTFYFLRQGQAKATIHVADMLLSDPHDLIHKAVGWALREMGRRVGQDTLVTYLSTRYKVMPRTALRYSIEHFDAETRGRYLRSEIS